MSTHTLNLVDSSVPVNREVQRFGGMGQSLALFTVDGVAPLVYFRPSAPISRPPATFWGNGRSY